MCVYKHSGLLYALGRTEYAQPLSSMSVLLLASAGLRCRSDSVLQLSFLPAKRL